MSLLALIDALKREVVQTEPARKKTVGQSSHSVCAFPENTLVMLMIF